MLYIINVRFYVIGLYGVVLCCYLNRFGFFHEVSFSYPCPGFFIYNLTKLFLDNLLVHSSELKRKIKIKLQHLKPKINLQKYIFIGTALFWNICIFIVMVTWWSLVINNN